MADTKAPRGSKAKTANKVAELINILKVDNAEEAKKKPPAKGAKKVDEGKIVRQVAMTEEALKAQFLGTKKEIWNVPIYLLEEFAANPRIAEEKEFSKIVTMGTKNRVADGEEGILDPLLARMKRKPNGEYYLRIFDGARRRALMNKAVGVNATVDVVIYPEHPDSDRLDKEYAFQSDEHKRHLSDWGRAVLLWADERIGPNGEDLSGLVYMSARQVDGEKGSEVHAKSRLMTSKVVMRRAKKVWTRAKEDMNYRVAIGGPVTLDPFPVGDYPREIEKNGTIFPASGFLSQSDSDKYLAKPDNYTIRWNPSEDGKSLCPQLESNAKKAKDDDDEIVSGKLGKKGKKAAQTAPPTPVTTIPATETPRVTMQDIHAAKGHEGTIEHLLETGLLAGTIDNKIGLDLAKGFTEALRNPATDWYGFRQTHLRVIAMGWALAKTPDSPLALAVGGVLHMAFKRMNAEIAATKAESEADKAAAKTPPAKKAPAKKKPAAKK